jgi:hypothetical protein
MKALHIIGSVQSCRGDYSPRTRAGSAAVTYSINMLDRDDGFLLLIEKTRGEGRMSQPIKKQTKRVKIKEGIDTPVSYDNKGKFLNRDMKFVLVFLFWFIGFIVILLYNWKQ